MYKDSVSIFILKKKEKQDLKRGLRSLKVA